jgi:hypothetical protein
MLGPLCFAPVPSIVPDLPAALPTVATGRSDRGGAAGAKRPGQATGFRSAPGRSDRVPIRAFARSYAATGDAMGPDSLATLPGVATGDAGLLNRLATLPRVAAGDARRIAAWLASLQATPDSAGSETRVSPLTDQAYGGAAGRGGAPGSDDVSLPATLVGRCSAAEPRPRLVRIASSAGEPRPTPVRIAFSAGELLPTLVGLRVRCASHDRRGHGALGVPVVWSPGVIARGLDGAPDA